MRPLLSGSMLLAGVLCPALASAQPFPTSPLPLPTQPDFGAALLAARCRSGDFAAAHKSECSPILRQQFSSAVSRAGTETVVIDGRVSQGVHERFDRGLVTQLESSEATFSSFSWPARYQSGADPTAPKQPAFEDAQTSSCNEYTYRRFYEANRFLEALGAFGRNHLGALALVQGGAGTLPALAYRALVDTDRRTIRDLDGSVTGVMSPKAWTGPKNVFLGAGSLLANAGPAIGTGLGDLTFARDLDAAVAFGRQTPYVTVNDHWRFARDKHAELQRRFALTQAEREDIARRLDAFESALRRHYSAFQRCVNERFAELSAQAPSLRDAIDGLRQGTIPGHVGDIDPSPLWRALDLEIRLLDPVTRAAALSSIQAGTSPTILHGLSGTLEPSTSLLSTLAVDRPALQRALADVAALFETRTTEGACAIASEATVEAARLLVAEHRLGVRGCLHSDRCDFSLPRFLRATIDRLSEIVAPTDEAQDRCLRALGPGELSAARLPVAKRGRLADVEAHLEAEIQRLQAALARVPHASLLSPRAIGDRREGGSTWGDLGSFGAKYHYQTDWGIEPAGTDAQGQVCRVAGQVLGELDSSVTVFGVHQDIVDARLQGTSERQGTTTTLPARVSGHLDILGERLYAIPADATGGRYRYSTEDRDDRELFSEWFLVGPIPVKVAAGVALSYGAAISLAISQGACDAHNPRLSISGKFEPHVGVGGWVTAAVDLFLVSAGVRGDLTLIDAGLPLSASVSVGNDARTAEPLAQATARLDLVLEELSGAISVFVSVLGIPYEHELFSWDGFRQTLRLWRESAKVPLRAFAVAGL